MPKLVTPRETPSTTATLPSDEPTAALLISAAVELMSKRGYQATSVRDLAEAAGTSPTVIYHYFNSKHDLLLTILNRSMDRLLEGAEQALFECSNDPAERLSALVEVHVRLHVNAPRESLLGNTELRSLEPEARGVIITKRDAHQRLFDRTVKHGVEIGVFSTEYPEEAARTVTASCRSVATWYRRDRELSVDQIVERYQSLMLNLVGFRR
ncbi:TetR/AcrR family transcriptional regulator [Aeromicrobium sp. Leaf350]|uniref:TetR/AcrR family transcriptional regulator n=1 Tax=Aeromicrobium sp. Leaf350 TaxID=2876565 RepID=UPI001E5E00C5|nr:TetR/AcrR family transcriptional regulator [Aeromicrobium sp. Leaf350]